MPRPRRRALDLLIAKRQPNLLRVFHPVKGGSYLLYPDLVPDGLGEMPITHPYMKLRREKRSTVTCVYEDKRLSVSLKRLTFFQIATGQLISLNIKIHKLKSSPHAESPNNGKLRFIFSLTYYLSTLSSG